MRERITITIAPEWLDRIDKERGNTPRARFIEELLVRAYGGKKTK